MTPQELRAEADKLDAEQAKANRGCVFINTNNGMLFIHDGDNANERISSGQLGGNYRKATPEETAALSAIPEFRATLERLSGGTQ